MKYLKIFFRAFFNISTRKFYCFFSGDIKEKKKKALKKSSEMTSQQFSELFVYFFFRPPILDVKKRSRKNPVNQLIKKIWPNIHGVKS